jgi:hypothetical protein
VGKRILGAMGAFAMVWAMLAVPFAQAEVTRESYKEAVEPICKTNTQANERILKGVRKDVKQGKLKLAGSKFSKAATALHKTLVQLKAEDKSGAQATVIRLTHNANQANNQVLGFEFHYCRFEPSKFT